MDTQDDFRDYASRVAENPPDGYEAEFDYPSSKLLMFTPEEDDSRTHTNSLFWVSGKVCHLTVSDQKLSTDEGAVKEFEDSIGKSYQQGDD